ncbi:MAG: hypothetical protein QM762_24845 [Chryseolinea sp.]
MTICYLEYFQLILQKVSFDRRLFNKEYGKAVRMLSSDQLKTLERWIQSRGLNHLMTSPVAPPSSVATSTEKTERSGNIRPNQLSTSFQTE